MMYITRILSNLSAWEKCQNDFALELKEISEAVRKTEIPDYSVKNKRHEKDRFNGKVKEIGLQITKNLENQFWNRETLSFGQDSAKGISNINAAKSGIGVEVLTGKYAFVESDIFVKFPLFLRAGRVNIGIVVVLVKSVAATGKGIVHFEMIERRIKQVVPFIPRYPFVIMGISNEPLELKVEELTSEFDMFLFENIGLTYADLKLQTEQHNCDFKEQLPDQAERVAKELCAFANNSKGGVLLIGVDDNGNKIGVNRNEIDQLQRRVLNIARDNCTPNISIIFKVFEIENQPERCIIAIRINEIERKPCMSQGRIYIRDNATAIPANPEQVRKLLFGSSAD